MTNNLKITQQDEEETVISIGDKYTGAILKKDGTAMIQQMNRVTSELSTVYITEEEILALAEMIKNNK